MSTIDTQRLGDGTGQAMAAWHRFSEVFEPLRPELYRYCRALTRSAWDAEDLVQDALARALVTLGCVFQEIDNPRAWLFRVASNVWIDRQRRQREAPAPSPPSHEAPPQPLTLEARDAGATLIGRLSPQERAAVSSTTDEMRGAIGRSGSESLPRPRCYDDEAGPVVRDVVRIDADGDRIARIRYHFFSPDVLADVCGELALPWRSNGYRYWIFGQ